MIRRSRSALSLDLSLALRIDTKRFNTYILWHVIVLVTKATERGINYDSLYLSQPVGCRRKPALDGLYFCQNMTL